MKNIGDQINKANLLAVDRILSAQPVLKEIKPASEAVPGMTKTTVLHAGPPIEWERMCDPMRGGVMGALIYEGLAETPDEAKKLAASGDIELSPCHHYNAVGGMAGILSASMPVFVVENETFGNKAYCAVREGWGKVVSYGSYNAEAIQKLRWCEKILAPALKAALMQSSGINLRSMTAQALQMGDECHNRSDAGTLLFLREIFPLLVKTDLAKETVLEVVEFLARTMLFYVRLSMAACKATMDAAHGTKFSTIVTAIARNGVDIGIRVSGLGDEWFTAPAALVSGLYFPGYSKNDANRDLGDSSITETAGLGGFAMAASPAIVHFVGGTYADAINYTKEMMEITITKNRGYAIPALDFEGTPTGIDIRKVVETGISPVINTAIAHKKAEIGQIIGAGVASAPMEMFKQALKALAAKLGE